MEEIFLCSVDDIIRILVSAVIVYILIFVYIRILGKRSTSELNNFDWIVTVSVGSIIASTVILLPDGLKDDLKNQKGIHTTNNN